MRTLGAIGRGDRALGTADPPLDFSTEGTGRSRAWAAATSPCTAPLDLPRLVAPAKIGKKGAAAKVSRQLQTKLTDLNRRLYQCRTKHQHIDVTCVIFWTDLLDFMEEQIRQSASTTADQLAAIDAASGVIPLMRDRLLKEDPEAQFL